jgi:hypothetical protein
VTLHAERAKTWRSLPAALVDIDKNGEEILFYALNFHKTIFRECDLFRTGDTAETMPRLSNNAMIKRCCPESR